MADIRKDDVTDMSPSDFFLYDTKKAELTGISDVISFTDSEIVAECKWGVLSVNGEELKIENFDSARGNLSLCGNINGIFYFGKMSKDKKKKGLFSK